MRAPAPLVATALSILLALPAAAAAETNHCEIAITGDSTVRIAAEAPRDDAQGKLSASTDYWLSDGQLRMALSTLVGVGSKLTPGERQRKVEDGMKRDPRFMVLLLNCVSDDGGIVLSPARGSKYADVPMKPGSYPIVPAGRTRPGQFTAMFHVATRGKRESYSVAEPGRLVVTRFDRRAITGTFRFKAEQRGKTGKKVDVIGSFSYACTGEACQK